MTIIIFLIILSALVVVHELGHFSVAKYFGIRVDEFGLGYPPKAKNLFAWKGTNFTLNWLPFGGFVKIFGENYDNTDLAVGQLSDSFQHKNRGIQASVLVAGVVGNFLFAWFLFFIILITGVSAPLRAAQADPLSPLPAVVESLRITGVLSVDTTKALGTFLSQAVVGKLDLSSVAGPVGLVGMVGKVSELGIGYLLTFTALISINLCIINLIPLPALDGGRLLFVCIEAITRKKISPKIFNLLNTLGFAFLILLMILVTVHDVRNIL